MSFILRKSFKVFVTHFCSHILNPSLAVSCKMEIIEKIFTKCKKLKNPFQHFFQKTEAAEILDN